MENLFFLELNHSLTGNWFIHGKSFSTSFLFHPIQGSYNSNKPKNLNCLVLTHSPWTGSIARWGLSVHTTYFDTLTNWLINVTLYITSIVHAKVNIRIMRFVCLIYSFVLWLSIQLIFWYMYIFSSNGVEYWPVYWVQVEKLRAG